MKPSLLGAPFETLGDDHNMMKDRLLRVPALTSAIAAELRAGNLT
jgi:hypothetical protein